ncbi:MAG: biotin synthase BioB [Candidatus Binatia bacterium]
MFSRIFNLAEEILEGREISYSEACRLGSLRRPEEVMALTAAANAVREKTLGPKVDLCSLVNAKSGICIEDCAFCAQSSHFSTGCPTYSLLSPREIFQAAQAAENEGAERFCIVTSGPAPTSEELENILRALHRIREDTRLELDCSLGKLGPPDFQALRQAGVTRYNHNLETAEDHFGNICSTHSYHDRVATVKAAQETGMEVCCGGILGLGETIEQRLRLAFALKELAVDCVPINLLNPRRGTPLAHQPPISPFEAIQTTALFRLILPDKIIKLAGGREHNLRDLQALGILAGANGLIIGGYLTTQGRSPEQDLQMIRDLGMEA